MYKGKPRKPVEGQIRGYNYVQSYKYLGTILTNYLSITGQMNQINQRAAGIELKLVPFRLHASFKFNLNFFKIMLNPQFRLMAILWN
jgi:hypothetical protein